MSSVKLLQIGILLTFGCVLIFCSCHNRRIAKGVNQKEKDTIVNKHNEVRLKIAKGEVGGQPKGTNLKKMKWDNSLASKAQKIANKCVFEHVKVTGTRWQYVGQNLYMNYTNAKDDAAPNWNAAVQTWFDEHKLYKYPSGFSKETGHYTQVVWADTDHVGCGYTYYKERNNYNKLFVCNYGPAGNFNNEAPYKTSEGNCQNLC